MSAAEESAYKAAILAAVQDDSRSNAILIVTAVFLGISLTSVLLRCFVRTRVVRAFGLDDIIMLLAMVGCLHTHISETQCTIVHAPESKYEFI